MNCTSVTPQSVVVCRLCSKSDEYYVNIFISNESCEIIVEDAIQDLLGLPVTVGDGLPNVVCRLCVRKLNEFREFKNMCFKSATELRAYALGNDFQLSEFDCRVKVEIKDDEFLDEGEKIKWNAFVEDQELTQRSESSDASKSGFKDEEASDLCGENEEGREEVPIKKEYHEGVTVYIESSSPALGNQCDVKEEPEEEAMESMAGVKCEIMEDTNDDDFTANTVSSLEADPLYVGKMERSSNMVGILQDPVKKGHHANNGTPYMAQNNALYHPLHDTLCRANTSQTRLKTFNCNVCGKKFYRRNDLTRHSDTHTGLRPFKCNVCEKTFYRKNDLKIHAICHTDLKPFKCNVCGKEFNRKSCLNMHEIIHTDLKPFKCDVCGKTFSRKCDLKTHAIIHTNLRPFKCEICGKDFKQKTHLKTHSAVHKD